MSASLLDLSLTPKFIDAVFRYADSSSWIALRVFAHNGSNPSPWVVDVCAGDRQRLIDEVRSGARYAANGTDPLVFSPAMCTFSRSGTAKTKDIAEGLALIIELDEGDTFAALARLETLIGR